MGKQPREREEGRRDRERARSSGWGGRGVRGGIVQDMKSYFPGTGNCVVPTGLSPSWLPKPGLRRAGSGPGARGEGPRAQLDICGAPGRAVPLPPLSRGGPGEARGGTGRDSEAGALVAQPPQVCQAVGPAVHLPAGALGQSPGPGPAAPAAAQAAAAAATAAGAATAAPVLVDGDLDLGRR